MKIKTCENIKVFDDIINLNVFINDSSIHVIKVDYIISKTESIEGNFSNITTQYYYKYVLRYKDK